MATSLEAPSEPVLRVFADSSVLFSAVRSRFRELLGVNPRGASLVLLELGHAGLIDFVATEYAVAETQGALSRKSSESASLLDRIIGASVRLVPSASAREAMAARSSVRDPDDAPILASALASGSQILVTLNTRHFPKEYAAVWVATPGDLVAAMRRHLAELELR